MIRSKILCYETNSQGSKYNGDGGVFERTDGVGLSYLLLVKSTLFNSRNFLYEPRCHAKKGDSDQQGQLSTSVLRTLYH